MPVDPKYSGLPGIAWDQPDLFETIQGKSTETLMFMFLTNITFARRG